MSGRRISNGSCTISARAVSASTQSGCTCPDLMAGAVGLNHWAMGRSPKKLPQAIGGPRCGQQVTGIHGMACRCKEGFLFGVVDAARFFVKDHGGHVGCWVLGVGCWVCRGEAFSKQYSGHCQYIILRMPRPYGMLMLTSMIRSGRTFWSQNGFAVWVSGWYWKRPWGWVSP